MNLEINTKATGQYRAQVLNSNGSVASDTGFQNNLILDQGLDGLTGMTWGEVMDYACIGTGNTPTKDTTASSASQTNTTVTRTAGAYDFSASDVGKLIHWTDGSEAKITAFISATEVTVAEDQTVVAQSFDLYRVNQVGLDAEVSRTNNYLSGSRSSIAGIDGVIRYESTYDFPVESTMETYREGAVSEVSTAGNNIFSRFVFDTPVEVDAGQQLRLTYQLSVDVGGLHEFNEIDLEPNFTGWPVTYTATNITSTATDFTVQTNRDHHYTAGEKVVISGTTSYDGEWTIVSVPSTDTFLITSALNPPTETTGNVVGRLVAEHGFARKAVHRGFNASTGASQAGVTSSSSARAFLEPELEDVSAIFASDPSSSFDELPIWDLDGDMQDTPRTSSYSSITGAAGGITGAQGPESAVAQPYVPGSFERVSTITFSPARGNDTRWQYLIFGGYYNSSTNRILGLQYYIKFTDRQRKDDTHALTLTITRKWGRAIS